jgi:hemerythrin-like domain-containing protein
MNEADFSMSEHHRDLEAHFERLVSQCQSGDLVERRCEWALFERELGQHMELEETELLPRFKCVHPAESAQILAEHAAIRASLAELGIGLDLRRLRADAINSFVGRVAAHARREDQLLYPWVQEHLALARWQPLGQQLGLLTRNIGVVFGVVPRGPGTSPMVRQN